MKQTRQCLLIVAGVLLLGAVTLAQSADYYLERVEIQARLLEAKMNTQEVVDQGIEVPLEVQLQALQSTQGVITADLDDLYAELDDWHRRMITDEPLTYRELKEGLRRHAGRLKMSAQTLSLSPEQATHLSLLTQELEFAAQEMESELVKRIAEDRDIQRENDRLNWGFDPTWNAWGPGGNGLWGPGALQPGPWGSGPWDNPFFGGPFGPGYGPRCW